jgi:hypothetical protein
MNILWLDYEPFGVFLWIELEPNWMEYLNYLNKQVRKFLEDDLVFIENNILKPTAKGKFWQMELSDLFYLNLEE